MSKEIIYSSLSPYDKNRYLKILWENNFDILFIDNLEQCLSNLSDTSEKILILEISKPEDYTLKILDAVINKEYIIPTIVIYDFDLSFSSEQTSFERNLFFLKLPFDDKEFLKNVKEAYSLVKLTRKVLKTVTETSENLIELAIHKQIGPELTSELKLDNVQKSIVKTSMRLIRAKECALWIVSKDLDDYLYLAHFHSYTYTESKIIKMIKIGDGIIGTCSKELTPIMVNDIKRDFRFDTQVDILNDEDVKAMIVVPLSFRGKLIGALQLNNRLDDGEFSEKDVQRLNTIADYASIALENAQVFQKTQELSITDDHSRLYNFRFLDTTLDQHLEIAKRYGRSLSLVFIDLDHLKLVNDSYGHLMGSKILSQVADLILLNIRNADFAIRYGGDEFVILLPETDTDGARIMAERLRLKFEDFIFLKNEGLNIKMTASIGVATFPDHAKTKEDLINAADAAMYEIKRSTRNGVCVTRMKFNKNQITE
jgi:diguanylate cyclase (GGDEF)-like protein